MSAQSPIELALARYSNWKQVIPPPSDENDTLRIEAASFLQFEIVPEKQHDDEQQAVVNGGGNDAEAILEKIYPTTKNHPEAEAQTIHTGVPHVRRLSRKPADRLSVLALHESLEARSDAADQDATAESQQQQGENSTQHNNNKQSSSSASSVGSGSGGGVCKEREIIYDDCFLELSRIIAIDCPERGDLMLALRSESAETQNSYDALFERAVQFGNRKSIERDFSKSMYQKIATLRGQTAGLDNRVSEMKAKLEGIVKRYTERRHADDRRHAGEVAFMKKNNGQMTAEIKRLTLAAQAQAQAIAEEKAAAAAARAKAQAALT